MIPYSSLTVPHGTEVVMTLARFCLAFASYCWHFLQLASHPPSVNKTKAADSMADIGTPVVYDYKHSQSISSPVGNLKPNDLGLFDVHGNECERRSRSAGWSGFGRRHRRSWTAGSHYLAGRAASPEIAGNFFSPSTRSPTPKCAYRSIVSVIVECRASVCATFGGTFAVTRYVMNPWRSE